MTGRDTRSVTRPWATSSTNSNIDLVQGAVQFYVPWLKALGKEGDGWGLKVVAGKFITAAGTEVIYSPSVDQISRSLLFGVAIPFTHTGIMAFQPVMKQKDGVTDSVTAMFGVANGWDAVKDTNESKMLHTGAIFNPCAEFSFTGNFFYSFSEQAGDEENGRTLVDLVTTVYPLKGRDLGEELDNVKLLGNFDWGGEEGAALDGGFAEWWGIADGIRYDKADDQIFVHRSSDDRSYQTTIGFDAMFIF